MVAWASAAALVLIGYPPTGVVAASCAASVELAAGGVDMEVAAESVHGVGVGVAIIALETARTAAAVVDTGDVELYVTWETGGFVVTGAEVVVVSTGETEELEGTVEIVVDAVMATVVRIADVVVVAEVVIADVMVVATAAAVVEVIAVVVVNAGAAVVEVTTTKECGSIGPPA